MKKEPPYSIEALIAEVKMIPHIGEKQVEVELRTVRCLGTSSLNGQLVWECDGNIVTAISEEEAIERFETIEVLHSLELACVIPEGWKHEES